MSVWYAAVWDGHRCGSQRGLRVRSGLLQCIILTVLSGAQRPQLLPRPPHFLGFQITHIYTHPPVRLLCLGDQPVDEAVAYTTHNKHKRRTSMPSVGFEPVIPVVERLQTYALDITVNGVSLKI